MQTLKELRVSSGLTQSEVANTIGVTIPTYSNYETGIVLPNLDDAIALEKYFGERINWSDNVDANDKREIMEALSSLSENYPLSSVLNFAQKYLKEGMRIGDPSKLILHFSKEANEIKIEPMLPTSKR